MSRKKILLVAVLLLGVSVLLPVGRSDAASASYICNVIMAGPGGAAPQVLLKLTDSGGSFSNRWFTARSGQEKTMLATALTAQANNMQIFIYTDTSLPGYPVITSMYLQ